jgi:hypothetical protein
MSNNHIELTKILVNRKLLIEGMTVSAKVNVRAFGYAPITTVKRGTMTGTTTDGIKVMYDDQKQRTTKFEDITAIEGMEVARFAQAYRVKFKK